MPFKPLQLSFGANPRYMIHRSIQHAVFWYWAMYYNTGNDISREEFPKGYAFDLTPDMCGASPHFNVVQKGNLAIDIQFSSEPTVAVSLVCYGDCSNTTQITHVLEQDPVTSKKFCSVFPSDKLPQTIDRYSCGFVANTDPTSEPGTH